MKGMLIKDFKLLRTRGIFLLLFVVVFVVMQFTAGKGEIGVGFASLMMGLSAITSITYDEYENGMSFLFTMPIQRRDYVREKYLFAFLMTTITGIIMYALCFCYDVFLLNATWENLLNKLVFCVAYLITSYVMFSFQIAARLKFPEHHFIITLAIAATIGTLTVPLYTHINWDLNWGLVAAAALVLAVLLIFGFYQWAVRTMERREF